MLCFALAMRERLLRNESRTSGLLSVVKARLGLVAAGLHDHANLSVDTTLLFALRSLFCVSTTRIVATHAVHLLLLLAHLVLFAAEAAMLLLLLLFYNIVLFTLVILSLRSV